MWFNSLALSAEALRGKVVLVDPIAVDNEFAICAFGNDAWPAKYIVDDRGHLVTGCYDRGSAASDVE